MTNVTVHFSLNTGDLMKFTFFAKIILFYLYKYRADPYYFKSKNI